MHTKYVISADFFRSIFTLVYVKLGIFMNVKISEARCLSWIFYSLANNETVNEGCRESQTCKFSMNSAKVNILQSAFIIPFWRSR